MSNYVQQNCTHDPDDFHQLAINRGQRKINYKLAKVDEHLIAAVQALMNVIGGNLPQQAMADATVALSKAKELNDKVAETRPPGCDPT